MLPTVNHAQCMNGQALINQADANFPVLESHQSVIFPTTKEAQKKLDLQVARTSISAPLQLDSPMPVRSIQFQPQVPGRLLPITPPMSGDLPGPSLAPGYSSNSGHVQGQPQSAAVAQLQGKYSIVAAGFGLSPPEQAANGSKVKSRHQQPVMPLVPHTNGTTSQSSPGSIA